MGDRTVNPVWTRRMEAVVLVLRGQTLRTAGPVALIVGTVVSLVNQGDVLLTGHVHPITWLRIAVNYVVPFIVASTAYLAACRRRS